ncbi:MAG: hypothetical protein OEZ55_08980, partial [Nitrospinota bacterium]|nr:hypothetical protein [Nitrospinota bacterium]
MKRTFIFILFWSLTLCASSAMALSASPDWVEANISLRNDGKVDFLYRIRYQVFSGTMGGFYLEGAAENPVFDHANCFAEGDNGARYNLDVRRMSSRKFDILLAQGARYGTGGIIFTLHFAADLGRQGHLSTTEAADLGKLTVFHWAPAQWDAPLSHQTMMIHYPIEAPGPEVDQQFLESVKFRTEKFMNKNYKIDYYGQPGGNGAFWFTVRLHKDGLKTREKMEIQQYVSNEAFPLNPASPARQAAPSPGMPFSQVAGNMKPPATADTSLLDKISDSLIRYPELLAGGLAALLSLFLPYKYGRFVQRARIVKQVSWEGREWSAPKVEVGTFRKPGKIADLEPVEAGVFLELPLTITLTAMYMDMETRGLVKIISRDPVSIRKLTEVTGNYYEQIALDAVSKLGALNNERIKELFSEVVDNIQKKTWDCDLEATKKHYRFQFVKAADQPLLTGDMVRDSAMTQDEWRSNNYYRHYNRHYYDGTRDYREYNDFEKGLEATEVGEALSNNYYDFMKSDA